MSFKKAINLLKVINKQEYIANKKKIANSSLLTFSSYNEDLKIRQDNLRFESYKILQPIMYFGIIFLFIMSIGVAKIDNKFIHDHTIISICLLLIALLPLLIVLHNFIKFLTITLIIRFPKMGIIGVQLITYLVFYKLLIDIIPENCKPFLIFKIIILSVLVIIQSIIFIKHLPNYLDFEISDTVSLLLITITIFTKVLTIELPRIIDTSLVVLSITQNVLNGFFKYKYKSDRKKANEIFNNQLLSEKIDYKELIKCYAIGGNKYKDKIIENEKFLRKINSVEVENIK